MKAETKHTPGPWKMTEYKTTDLSREVKIGVDTNYPPGALCDGSRSIASMTGGAYCQTGGSMKKFYKQEIVDTNYANARLISAAPEMLAALEAVRESFVHIPGSVAGNKLRTQILARCENVKTALNQARAAISKAKGNQ